MHGSVVLALACMLASAACVARPALDVDALLRESVVVDGVVHYYPKSQKPGEGGIGKPHFERDEQGRSIKQATGIDLGPISLSSLRSLRGQRRAIEKSWSGVSLILTRVDLERCIRERKYGVLFYVQKHWPLRGKVDAIQEWFDEGLRIFQPQYGIMDGNQGPLERLGGGTAQRGGLTALGRRVVRECIRVGLMLDVSHCNPETTIEVCEIARRHGVPVTANHVGVRNLEIGGRWLARYARNITDEELIAIRNTGGVVGIMGYGPYLRGPYQGLRKIPPTRNIAAATIDDFVAHVDYVAKKIGVEHVGFATDGYLDGTMAHRRQSADGILDGPRRWFEATRRLYALGYSRHDLRKMLGGNFLRVYRQLLPANDGSADDRATGLR